MTEAHPDTLRRGGLPGGAAAASLFRERRRFTLTLIAPAAIILLVFQVPPILMGADASLRRFSLTEFTLRPGAVGIISGVARFQRNRPAEIGNRLRIQPQVRIGNAPVIVG